MARLTEGHEVLEGVLTAFSTRDDVVSRDRKGVGIRTGDAGEEVSCQAFLSSLCPSFPRRGRLVGRLVDSYLPVRGFHVPSASLPESPLQAGP